MKSDSCTLLTSELLLLLLPDHLSRVGSEGYTPRLSLAYPLGYDAIYKARCCWDIAILSSRLSAVDVKNAMTPGSLEKKKIKNKELRSKIRD